MRIGIMDVDGHHFPNLALMKISQFHKQKGDSVEFVNHFQHYDIVYKSKIFTFTIEDKTICQADEIRTGGTGYRDYSTLPNEIEHLTPDYNLYPITKWYDRQTAYGFTTRGCPNHCPWCIVPVKESYIRQNADIHEFLADKKKVILLDNNILAHVHGLNQIETLIKKKIAVDFTQGLEARRIADSPEITDILTRVKYISSLKIACDTDQQIESVEKTFSMLKAKGFPASKILVYCLVREDLENAKKRVMKIRDLGGRPFAMPYRDFTPNYIVPETFRHFARWVNHKAIFYSCSWEEYKNKIVN